LESILMGLNVRVIEESEPGLLYQFAKYLAQMEADEVIAILIDEAQDFPEEVLTNLSMFSDLESRAVQIVLVGQPEFENSINSQGLRQIKQQIKIRRQIRGLTGEESQNYIDHRLKLVGSSSSQTFTPKALSMICSHAQGIPRIINIVCDNACLKGYRLSKKRIDVDIIRQSIRDMESHFLRKTFLSTIAQLLRNSTYAHQGRVRNDSAFFAQCFNQ
jgi:type II secretory pathway predicted ATPase ExeA